MSVKEKDGLSSHLTITTPPTLMDIDDAILNRKRLAPTEDRVTSMSQHKKTNEKTMSDPSTSKGPDPVIGQATIGCEDVSLGEQNVLIVIKSTEDKAIFTKPWTLTMMLNDSPFGKYIIENSVSILGRGVGCKFLIKDLAKLEASTLR